MSLLTLAKVPFIMNVVAVLWVLIAIVLILLILLQKGRGGGIGGVFGGGTASTLLGSKTGDFFTWVTIVMVVLFLGIGVLMAKFYRHSKSTGVGAPMTPPAQVTATEGSETDASGSVDAALPVEMPSEVPAEVPAEETPAE